MTLANESSFLQLVEGSRDQRCRELIESAEAQAREIVGAARREAGARVRRAIAANRERRRTELGAAHAELATRLRLVTQQTERAWLDRAWPRLVAELERRWRAAETRRAWIDALVAQASSLLEPGAEWRIEHPAELDPSELESIAERPEQRPTFVADPTLSSGLRIHASGATLDGSRAGLLSRPALAEGRLLAALEQEPR